jgi:hypothetical protein
MELVLHIGMPKTGTTSIQESLHVNRALLSARGIFIPTSLGRRNHRRFSTIFEKSLSNHGSDFSSKEPSLSQKQEQDAENLMRFEEEVRLASGHRKFVISSEQMSWRYEPKEIQRLATVCSKYFDIITVVLFLRPQWEAIPSRYWLDLRTSLLTKSFGLWLREEALLLRQFNYLLLLDTWATNFPDAKLQPILTSGASGFDSVETFYRDVLKLDTNIVKPVSVGRKNKTGSGLDVVAFRTLNFLIEKSHRARRLRAMGLLAARAKRRLLRKDPRWKWLRSFRVSNELLMQIAHHFTGSNHALSAKYFPKSPMFDDSQNCEPQNPFNPSG